MEYSADFTVDMSFSVDEIKTMFNQYEAEKKVQLDKDYFAERLRFYTSGYLFLVSKLCKIINEKIMKQDELVWKNEYMDMAVKELLKDSNTNFDSLFKNLENNKDLYNLVKRIVLDNERFSYIISDKIISLGSIYGIIKDDNGICKVDNKIYEQLIYDHMMINVGRSDESSIMSNYNYRDKL